MFKDPDISKVKAYMQREWIDLLTDRASVKDYIFAKEVKFGHYS